MFAGVFNSSSLYKIVISMGLPGKIKKVFGLMEALLEKSDYSKLILS